MACRATPAQLIQLLAASPVNFNRSITETLASGITTDSRTVKPGEIFVALRGDNFDGHQFVETAIRNGAIAAVTDHPVYPTTPVSEEHSIAEIPQIVVEDTLAAYQAIAHWWRRQLTIPIIAVTGSVGKTTTKELVAAVLSTTGSVLKTQANYNNEIGVPKTLLEIGTEHDYAVVEMGMRGLGEIALLAQIAVPDIAVITNVGTAHIGRLGSEQAIANAKCELVANLPETGTAILNHDNLRLIETAATVWSGKTLTYGLEGGDLHGTLLDTNTLAVGGFQFPLPLPGRHNALNYLAALAVARVLNLDWAPLTTGITVQLPQGRARRYELPENIWLLDETYNAGLESMIAALQFLAETPAQRRIAVLGTMKELGDRSPEFHHQVGKVVRDLGLDYLLILADPAEADAMAAGAVPVPSEQFSNHETLTERLMQLIRGGDRLLFKASRAVQLDRTVEQLRRRLQQEMAP